MRLGAVHDHCQNALYRAILPLRAMQQRGHDVVWPPPMGVPDLDRLRGCDVVHIYRRVDADVWKAVSDLTRRGTAIVYDNDDDYSTIPPESPMYKHYSGSTGRRAFENTARIARAAHVFTTTTDALAERYRRFGVESVEVIGNYLPPGFAARVSPHDGIVVGWVAGAEHRADVARIPIGDGCSGSRSDIRMCSSTDLGLKGRYRYRGVVPYDALPHHISGFDIAVAPLSDIPFNRVRSDVKLKEYAACGVPWLASPIGPHAGHGEAHGGLLVPDDGWFEALDQQQTIAAAAERWEGVYRRAVELASSDARQPAGGVVAL